MNIQWYPGHMTKAKRMMQENLKVVDLIIELVDARIPYSSKNPDIDLFARNKKRILIMNKIDLADEEIIDLWKTWYEQQGFHVILLNSNTGKRIGKVTELALVVCKEKIEQAKKRGRIFRPVRAMVVGIPNVGKSTFINKLVGRASTKTGNKPGVTKGKQWIKLKKDLELLDTPGILWPKFDDEEVGLRLAFIGSIKDDIIDIETLALHFIQFFKKEHPEVLEKRYGGNYSTVEENIQILEIIGEARRFYGSNGTIDLERTSKMIIDEFRSGKLGRFTLERPPNR